MMQQATVRPEKLREALGEKLGTAVFALHDLREADEPELNRFPEPRRIAVAFLHAARGVVPTAKTFRGPGFDQWLKGWEKARLPEPERLALWQEMHTARRFQEHGDSAGLIDHRIEITRGDNPQRFQNAALLGLQGSQMDNRCWKGGVRFAAYPDRPVSEVCAEYFDMCQLFVDDFLRDHAHLIPHP